MATAEFLGLGLTGGGKKEEIPMRQEGKQYLENGGNQKESSEVQTEEEGNASP